MTDDDALKLCLEQAHMARQGGNFPVGAVVVRDGDGKVVAAGHNRVAEQGNALEHAEIVTLWDAHEELYAAQGKTGASFTLYASWEPCPMCFGAALFCGINRIVWAADDIEMGMVTTGSGLEMAARRGITLGGPANAALRYDSLRLIQYAMERDGYPNAMQDPDNEGGTLRSPMQG